MKSESIRLSDLREISGIGDKTMERVRDKVYDIKHNKHEKGEDFVNSINVELDKVYQMDNLELLSSMSDKSVDLIYCDILYNTGRTFKTKDKKLAYKDKIGSREDVVNFYKPRLEEMKRVLSDSGAILLQCDYRISPIIQLLSSDLFIFQDKIIWKKSATGKGAKAKKVLSKDYDEIIYLTKSNTFVENKINKPHDITSLKEFKYHDEGGYFKIVPLGMYSDISVELMREQGQIYTSKFGKDYKKYYLTDMNETCFSNIWVDCYNLYSGANKERVDYPTQKPKALLERLIYMFSNEGDTVADFFCGSGTTCVVAKELGRKYIGCDIGERAVDITNERLNEVTIN